MFGTIRKHSTWLWMIVITLTVISFVFWGSQSGCNQANNVQLGSIYQVPITLEEYERARREVNLDFFIRRGGWPDNNDALEQQTYLRIFWVRKLQEHDIRVDDESVTKLAGVLLGNRMSVDDLAKRISGKATLNDFQRYLRHNLGLEQLWTLLGLSGDLLTPQEAEALYRRERQEVVSRAVFFSATNYMNSVTNPSPGVLQQFYTSQKQSYRLPDRMTAGYVEFDITNRLEQAEKSLTNLSEIVEAEFQKAGTNYLLLGKTPEEAKARIQEEVIRQQAYILARQQAAEFADKLFNLSAKPNPADLFTLARSNGLTAKMTQPFDVNYGPKEFDGGPNFARQVFALTPEEPFTPPIVGEGAIYVASMGKLVPAEDPPLEQIRDQVIADHRRIQAIQLARSHATRFLQAVTNGLNAGKTFEAIAAEAKVKPADVPPIALNTPSAPEIEEHIDLDTYKKYVWTATPGKPIYAYTADGGGVIYYEKMLPINEAKKQAEWKEFMDTIRTRRRQEAINDWLVREGQEALKDTPLVKRREQQQPPVPQPLPPGAS